MKAGSNLNWAYVGNTPSGCSLVASHSCIAAYWNRAVYHSRAVKSVVSKMNSSEMCRSLSEEVFIDIDFFWCPSDSQCVRVSTLYDTVCTEMSSEFDIPVTGGKRYNYFCFDCMGWFMHALNVKHVKLSQIWIHWHASFILMNEICAIVPNHVCKRDVFFPNIVNPTVF